MSHVASAAVRLGMGKRELMLASCLCESERRKASLRGLTEAWPPSAERGVGVQVARQATVTPSKQPPSPMLDSISIRPQGPRANFPALVPSFVPLSLTRISIPPPTSASEHIFHSVLTYLSGNPVDSQSSNAWRGILHALRHPLCCRIYQCLYISTDAYTNIYLRSALLPVLKPFSLGYQCECTASAVTQTPSVASGPCA